MRGTQSTADSTEQRLKPYAEYKDSGIEWLGKIPSDWQIKHLKFVSSINMGQSPPSEIVNTLGDGLPFLQGNADFGAEHPSVRTFCFSPPKTAEPLDILLSVRAPVGALNIADMKYGIGRGLCAMRPSMRYLEQKYCYYVLQIARLELDAIAKGSTYDAVSADDVSCLSISLPPVDAQRTIGLFLDRETKKIDALIAKKERLIELLQEKRTALITQAVTKGLDPNVPMKDSGIKWLGKIPAHWEVMKTKYAAGLRSGHTPSRQHPEYWENCTIPWFGLADVWQIRSGRREYVSETSEKISALGLANSAACLLPKGTVILSRTASVGFSAIMDTPMATTQDYVNWVCGESLVPEFLLYVFRAMTREFERLMMGSTHQTIYMPDVARFICPIPPIEEQGKIVAYIREQLQKINELAAKVHAAIDYLKEYRTALISTVVTGKIDVRNVS
jgi:type I restriction enzyme S subunit